MTTLHNALIWLAIVGSAVTGTAQDSAPAARGSGNGKQQPALDKSAKPEVAKQVEKDKEQSLTPIARRLPPAGIEVPQDARQRLGKATGDLVPSLLALGNHPLRADAEALVKAVALALRHGEFYAKNDIAKATSTLAMAAERIKNLKEGKAPWTTQRGLIVRGYYSSIDGSPQPYGLVVPKELSLEKPVPLYVWLHGRGDKVTDLHFIHRRLNSAGNVHPKNAITLHPFGRQCIGYKSAGETDVLEAIAHVSTQYKIDPNRIVLMGFSMGGAGAWHIGAHYADRWAALSPGAGFAETARYNRLSISSYPPVHEQRLWTLYDVPNYVRNLFNIPVIAYSGENDKQIQAARVMEQAYLAHGKKLPHLIGPGMGHRYHPKTLEELLQRVQQAVVKGRNPHPEVVHLQTRTLRYPRMYWVTATALDQHWRDSRVDARISAPRQLEVATRNVRGLELTPFKNNKDVVVNIDGQNFRTPVDYAAKSLRLERINDLWRWRSDDVRTGLAKKPGLQGPIDDVLMAPFLVVAPSSAGWHPSVDRWVKFELGHFMSRWRAVYRGELRIKLDHQVTPQDVMNYNLILWGDPQSNQVIQRLLTDKTLPHALPLAWNEDLVRLYGAQASSPRHVPVLIYPNPLNPEKYVVLNSGSTHREAHDRTNSLQNPKLPDWSLLNIDNPPTASAAGRVVAAGFFGESWE